MLSSGFRCPVLAFFSLLGFLVVAVGTPLPSHAQSNAIEITPKSAFRFVEIPDLDQFSMQAACYFPPNEPVILGTIEDEFFTPISLRQIAKRARKILTVKAISLERAVRRATRKCRTEIKRPSRPRTPQGNPSPAASPGPSLALPSQSPSSAPSVAPSAAPSVAASPPPSASQSPAPSASPSPSRSPQPSPSASPPALPVLTISAGGPYNGAEGTTQLLSASASGGSGQYRFEWDLNANDQFETSGQIISWLPADNGNFMLALLVTDTVTGTQKRASATGNINNRAPTAAVNGPRSGTTQDTLSFTASAQDPSSVDQNAGFTFGWNFGDGTPLGSGSSVTHRYTQTGTFTLSVTARDKDQATSSAASITVTVSAPSAEPPIPELALWESHMTSFAVTNCNNLINQTLSFDTKLLATYYDAEWVFYQIADYTHDPSWNNCAQRAEAIYRDQYVRQGTGGIPGYWSFTHGLAQDYLRTGDTISRQTLVMIAQNAAYHADYTPVSWTEDDLLSRENAYSIMAYLNAEDVGEPRRARLAGLIDNALGHIDQWAITQDADYVKPFMVGLTMHALIMYYDRTGDPRVRPAILTALDWIWAHTWVPASESFLYINHDAAGEDPSVPAPDLNLLIAPAFAWAYRQTGTALYRDRGDQIFAGGVRRAFLGGGKQFNQNYRWSFEYVRLRK